MPPNVYDKASRYAAKADPPGFLAWLLGLPADGFVFHAWLDARGVPFPGDADRTGDTVARLGDPAEHGLPWVVAVEFQTRPDPDMFGRMLGYLSGLWLELRPDDERGSRFHVGAAVVNLTGSDTTSRDMRWPAAGLLTHLGIVERNLERESADELLTGVESGRWSRCVLPWVPLMAGGDDPGLVDRWKVLAEAEPDPRRRANYAVVARVFAEKAGRKELWVEKLEGWNVEESTVVNEFFAEARAAALIEVLAEKFGPPPEDVATAIRGTTDVARLRGWMSAAVRATTIDDFRRSTGL